MTRARRVTLNVTLVVALLGLAGATTAHASVVFVPGEQLAREVEQRLSVLTCERHQCVSFALVSQRGRLAWPKVTAAKVDGVVVTRVVRGARGYELRLELRRSARQRVWSKTLRLGAQPAVGQAVLSQLARELGVRLEALESMRKAGAGLVAETPPEPKAPAAPPLEEAPLAPVPPPVAPTAEVPPPAPAPLPPLEPEPDEERVGPFVEAELGVSFFSRSLSYSGLTGSNLLAYRPSALAMPQVLLRVWPALAGGGEELWWIEVSYARALGLSTQTPDAALHATGVDVLEINSGYGFLLSEEGSELSPLVGFHRHAFRVEGESAGESLQGLPGVSYVALRLGARLGLVLLSGRLRLGLDAAFLPAFSAGEMVSQRYFTKGSATALSGRLSARYHVLGPLALGGAVEWRRYALAFTTTDEDPYRARGASDTYWFGTVFAALAL